jgi:hypothetical protein
MKDSKYLIEKEKDEHVLSRKVSGFAQQCVHLQQPHL